MKQQPYDPGQVTHPLDVLKQAAGIGGITAVPGTAIGAVSGTLRTQTPVLFAIASGLQCFALGSTFWTARTAILNPDGLTNWWKATRGLPLVVRNDLNPTPSEKVRASTIAGAFTGLSLGLLFRGPRNAIPGTFMFSLFGFTGQHGYNFLDRKNTEVVEEDERLAAKGEKRKNFMERIAEMKWSPMEVLTDERYEEMLQEKLLKIEVEIALVDDRIEIYKQMAREVAAKQAQEQMQEQAKGTKV
jgi:chorismate mutase